MDNKEHVLLCILGKTASGKDFLTNKLCERTGLKQLISYTTRERRVDEGETHIFATEEDYEQMQTEGGIAAFTQIGAYKYWATIDQLYQADCYIIDYAGLKKLREFNLPNLRLVTVFINTPDDVREERALNKRKDDKTKFRTRSFAEREQFREMQKNADFDYAISNVDGAKAYSVLRWISTVEGVWQNNMEDTTK
jgi:guanylate kinase